MAVLAGALALPAAASACSCVAPQPAEQLREADGAVVARLLAVRPVGDGLDANFVYRTGLVVKGDGLRRGRRLVLRSSRSSAACGLPTDVGGLQGMFLSRTRGRWGASLCSLTTRRVLRRLDGGAAPAAAASSCAT